MAIHDFTRLFDEFLERAWGAPRVLAQRQLWMDCRDEARGRWARVLAMRARSQTYADAVLDGLLPYADTAEHRAKDRWIHPSSALTVDVRAWFEREGWARQSDWPYIAQAVATLVERCMLCPEKLQEACDRFMQRPEAQGFQSWLLSPILNALVPDRYAVVNARTLRTLRAFTGVPWSPRLETYPRVNEALRTLVEQNRATLTREATEGHPPHDVFDLFATWFVARSAGDAEAEAAWDIAQASQQEHELPCWKFTPGERAQRWFACLAEQTVSLAWPEFGDLSALAEETFDARLGALASADASYRGVGAEHLWRLARSPVGSVVIAARGGGTVIGVGRTTGPYHHARGDAHPHRLPVDWFDTTERTVDANAWGVPLARLDVRWVEDALGVSFSGLHGSAESSATFAPRDQLASAAVAAQSSAPPPLPETPAPLLSPSWSPPGARTERHAGAPPMRASALRDVSLGSASAAPRRRTGAAPAGRLETSRSRSARPPRDDAHATPAHATPAHATPAHATPAHATPAHVARARPEASLAELARATSFPEEELRRWVAAIRRKGQAIVSGPSGAGKTFLARHLARHLAGRDGLVEMLQFHASYRYEDFIEGRAPDGGGAPGRLLEFLARADEHGGTAVLLIDEIHRADLARVLGESLHALEYREQPVRLASGASLAIPRDVLVLGTMSASDRAITVADQTLRRRFAFLALGARYDVLDRYLAARGFDASGLVEMLRAVNRALGDGDQAVGIASFFRDDLAEVLDDVWSHEVVPHLERRLDPERVAAFRWERVRDAVLPAADAPVTEFGVPP